MFCWVLKTRNNFVHFTISRGGTSTFTLRMLSVTGACSTALSLCDMKTMDFQQIKTGFRFSIQIRPGLIRIENCQFVTKRCKYKGRPVCNVCSVMQVSDTSRWGTIRNVLCNNDNNNNNNNKTGPVLTLKWPITFTCWNHNNTLCEIMITLCLLPICRSEKMP